MGFFVFQGQPHLRETPMRTHRVLQKFLSDSFTDIHAKRLEALAAAVDAVAQGVSVSITAMGRSLCSAAGIKHRVKRMDRLIGNSLLSRERTRFYRSLAQRLLIGCTQPIILIEGSSRVNGKSPAMARDCGLRMVASEGRGFCIPPNHSTGWQGA